MAFGPKILKKKEPLDSLHPEKLGVCVGRPGFALVLQGLSVLVVPFGVQGPGSPGFSGLRGWGFGVSVFTGFHICQVLFGVAKH